MKTSSLTVTIEVSLLEAAMVKRLREFPFGEFTIHKLDGEPRRIVIQGSEMLKEDQGKELAETIKLETKEGEERIYRTNGQGKVL